MGGGCRNITNRETIFAGGKCENNCFSHYGGCNASDSLITKQKQTCELFAPKNDLLFMPLEEINQRIDKLTSEGKSVFLYVPDIFSNCYWDLLFKKLPSRNGNTYIAINACVKSMVKKKIDLQEVKSKGIMEIWIGVESSSLSIRNKYGKPYFKNSDVIRITQDAKKLGINICWYMIDGKEDTNETRLRNYNFIKKGNPFRVNIEELQ